MVIFLIICALLVLSLPRAFGDNVTIDLMNDNHSAWKQTIVDSQHVIEGKPSFKWPVGVQSIQCTDLAFKPANYHRLALWVYSDKATFERVQLSLLTPAISLKLT